MQELIPNAETYPVSSDSITPPDNTREPVLITIVGSSAAIDLIIKILHRLRFADVGAWSKTQIDSRTGKAMRVLTKWVRH